MPCHWVRKWAKEYVRANNSSGKFPYGVPMEKLSAAALQILPLKFKAGVVLQKPSSGIPQSSLELAKGFEPLTL